MESNYDIQAVRKAYSEMRPWGKQTPSVRIRMFDRYTKEGYRPVSIMDSPLAILGLAKTLKGARLTVAKAHQKGLPDDWEWEVEDRGTHFEACPKSE